MEDEADNYLKVTLEAQLGLIGGTMGLLTGFSILSGVEIIYYLLRLVIFSLQSLHIFTTITRSFSGSSRPSRFTELWTVEVSVVSQRIENHRPENRIYPSLLY